MSHSILGWCPWTPIHSLSIVTETLFSPKIDFLKIHLCSSEAGPFYHSSTDCSLDNCNTHTLCTLVALIRNASRSYQRSSITDKCSKVLLSLNVMSFNPKRKTLRNLIWLLMIPEFHLCLPQFL